MADLLGGEAESVEDDLVVVYASVEGRDRSGALRAERATLFCPSIEVGGRRLRAIQSTTAAGIAEVLRIVLEGDLSGPLLQSQVPTETYLNGPFAKLAYVDEQARG